MSLGNTLKDTEIFSEINNSSGEESSSENESKEDNNASVWKKVSLRKIAVRNKKAQTIKTLPASKNEFTNTTTQETQLIEGRLSRKRKAQRDDSQAKVAKIDSDSCNSNTEVEKTKTFNVGSEDETLLRSSAKKNLFSDVGPVVPRVRLTDCTTPTKKRRDDQNDKENRVQSPNKHKNETTPQKRSTRKLNLEEHTQSVSPAKNKLTPLKLAQTPTKKINFGSGSYEQSPGTLQTANEFSPIKNRSGETSNSKQITRSASKPKVDGELKESESRTKTPQKERKSTNKDRELKRLNIDCIQSFYEATSPVRSGKSNFRKTATPQKHEDVGEDPVKTPRKGVAKATEKVNECFTPSRNRNKLLSEVKGTPLTPAVRCGVNKEDKTTPLQRFKATVTTPVSKKKSGRGFLTPSMAKKEHIRKDKTDDDLDTTRKQLHISTIPKSLPCRDSEFDQIKSFLVRKIEHSAGGCMYISGVPGTGKTATVHAVVRSIQQQVDIGDLPDFDFVEVNGLRLTEPKQAYVRILQELTDKKLSPDQAQQLLNKRFSGNCKKSTIILVDELDYLCNRRQDVVYNILDWPTKRGSALVVLTISNTMDLPERTLKGRVTSRMGLTRVTFQPYSFHQLKAIVEDRLSGTDTFHPDAVQLVARKVAAVSGDARRALDICRRTTELVTDGEQVTASHVQRALEQIFSGPRVTVIQRLCRQGQLVLRAIRDVNQRTGVDEVIARQVYQHLLEICLVDGCPRPTVGAMLETCVSLVALGLIVAEKGRVDVTRKMSLNVSSDDIHYALDKTKV